jgi:cell cycle checkpoint control protein RAD9A
VAIEDGEGVKSRFIARIVFRNGLTSTHRLSYEVAVPVHAKFNRQESPHHWTMSSKTLRQLMDHFGPGVEFLDINTNGNLVNFTCFSEKKVAPDGMYALRCPCHHAHMTFSCPDKAAPNLHCG